MWLLAMEEMLSGSGSPRCVASQHSGGVEKENRVFWLWG